jgi:glutamate synthase (NADPH/NADH) large chain
MRYIYDHHQDHSSCGVGFITHKGSRQTHQLLELAHQALCKIPHRGGMSAEGIGDGAGVNIDLSLSFYQYLTNRNDLTLGSFGVANFFYPKDKEHHTSAETIIKEALASFDLPVITWRNVEVDPSVLNAKSAEVQLSIRQVVFERPASIADQAEFEQVIHQALEEIEYPAFTRPELEGFYPLSMSSARLK